MPAHVEAFFDAATSSYSYVVSDPATAQCAIIDPVLDYDAAAGRTAYHSADRLLAYIRDNKLNARWILETHVHADHLSAAAYLKQTLGAKLGIGAGITLVQQLFGALFDAEAGFATDGRQFDHLFRDGERFQLGSLPVTALHTPGHTPACITYLIGDAAFVGDTLFMPDYGTARCDFPGGDAATLYRSVHKLFTLPDTTRVYTGHDYTAPGRAQHACQSSIGAQKQNNIHVHEGVSQDAFVTLRQTRDATLAVPALIIGC